MASNRANRITPVVCNPVAVVPGSDLPVIDECDNDQGTGMDQAIKIGHMAIANKDVYQLKAHQLDHQKAVKKVAELYRPKQLEQKLDYSSVSRSAEVNIGKNYKL
jgi:hypothetical protein